MRRIKGRTYDRTRLTCRAAKQLPCQTRASTYDRAALTSDISPYCRRFISNGNNSARIVLGNDLLGATCTMLTDSGAIDVPQNRKLYGDVIFLLHVPPRVYLNLRHLPPTFTKAHQ